MLELNLEPVLEQGNRTLGEWLRPEGLVVRVEIDEDHPAMRDAMGDYPELDSDNIELLDTVPFDRVEEIRFPQRAPLEVWTRVVTAKERAARARRQGFSRLSLPELDNGLRR